MVTASIPSFCRHLFQELRGQWSDKYLRERDSCEFQSKAMPLRLCLFKNYQHHFVWLRPAAPFFHHRLATDRCLRCASRRFSAPLQACSPAGRLSRQRERCLREFIVRARYYAVISLPLMPSMPRVVCVEWMHRGRERLLGTKLSSSYRRRLMAGEPRYGRPPHVTMANA